MRSITALKTWFQTQQSCDLLSNCIFNAFYHSYRAFGSVQIGVVICFQIVSLMRSITAEEFENYMAIRL